MKGFKTLNFGRFCAPKIGLLTENHLKGLLENAGKIASRYIRQTTEGFNRFLEVSTSKDEYKSAVRSYSYFECFPTCFENVSMF